jgi:hypothetical protein
MMVIVTPNRDDDANDDDVGGSDEDYEDYDNSDDDNNDATCSLIKSVILFEFSINYLISNYYHDNNEMKIQIK